jgi:hypothetical protein
MPTYYNLTKFADNEGFMSVFSTVSSLTNNLFGVFLQFCIFIVPLMVYLQKGEHPNDAIHLSSLYCLIAGIIFYISQINTSSLAIWIPSVLFVTTLAIRWYNAGNQ